MDDQACPRCKTTKYRNPSLVLMVNVCGHALCESCVDLLFLKGSGSCPECNVPLRRSNFRVQLFEDATVEKEVDIRKRVLKDYNKKEEDFATAREYNDYLEEIETIIFNLTNNIDVVATNKRIEAYKRDNKDVIMRNKVRAGREEIELEEILDLEKQEEENRKMEIVRAEKEAKKRKMREKEALIDELMFSHDNAKNIIENFTHNSHAIEEEVKAATLPTTKATQFSTGIKFTRGSSIIPPLPQVLEGPLYVYRPPTPATPQGPAPPLKKSLDSDGYMKHIITETQGEKAGGYTSHLACLKSLQEALAGLYHCSS